MKRTFIGFALSLIGTIWGVALLFFVGNNLVSSWQTPPGRFFTSLSSIGMTLPFVISIILLTLGFVILGIEYCRGE